MIKVILKEDVIGLGRAGEVKQVKDGYARNFLFPKNLVFLANAQNLKQVETQQKKLAVKRETERKKAQDLADRLASLSVTIAVDVNEDEKMYGSLTVQDIAKAVCAEGVEVEKKMILLQAPIRELGIYDLDLRLHAEVKAKVKVWVVKK